MVLWKITKSKIEIYEKLFEIVRAVIEKNIV